MNMMHPKILIVEDEAPIVTLLRYNLVLPLPRWCT